MRILGISCFYHDSAACLVNDGEILAAAQEERFTRKKHDANFPKNAVAFCLKEAGISMSEIDYAVFYEKPFLKFERILETYLAFVPAGLSSFLMAMPTWLKKKLWIKNVLENELSGFKGKILFVEHHHAHAASAFFPSPFEQAAVLTIDGVGEWTTTSFGTGKGNSVEIEEDLRFPHSLGLFYSAFTYYTGFKVNSGEYKMMGLAPYGEPKYVDLIKENLIDLKEDGSFRLNMRYFNYGVGLTMTNNRFHKLFGHGPRKSESPLNQFYMDVAASCQKVTEEIILKMAGYIKQKTGQRYLCLAGGVALNCVANGLILRQKLFDDIWIQPAAGDAGGALGAALAVWYGYLGKERKVDGNHDLQKGSYLGPEFNDRDILKFLEDNNISYTQFSKDDLIKETANLLSQGNVVGWFQGRMEFGPRALGARSILGDARSPEMQKKMNLKIKFRESFRPFAPSVLIEEASNFFEIDRPSPYMLLVAYVKNEIRRKMTVEEEKLFGIDKLNVVRSSIPAVTHLDYSARLQTVDKSTNPKYWRLIRAFQEITGCPVIVNTSFNVRGEPIVCSIQDAYKCFMRTEMDYLAIGNFLLEKLRQKPLIGDDNWQKEFKLD